MCSDLRGVGGNTGAPFRCWGSLYIDVTSNLLARTVQHREGLIPGFTKRYGIRLLVWYEMHETMEAAILREKRLKE